jgi:hypothetical protein
MSTVASLNKFTVPFDGNTQGLLMPKLKYRFRATFLNFGGTGTGASNAQELTKQVVDIKRPSVNFNPFALDIYNSKIYMQGKPEWQETTVNLRDDMGGQVGTLVSQQIQKQFDFLEQSSAASGGNYKFDLVYEVLDGGNGKSAPVTLEKWEMTGCQISQADWGDMNYGTSEAAMIALTIRFDNAVLHPTGGDADPAYGKQVRATAGVNTLTYQTA